MQQQQQPLGSDESSDDATLTEGIQSDKLKWDKYNLDEYGADQDESVQGSEQGSEKPVHIYNSFL